MGRTACQLAFHMPQKFPLAHEFGGYHAQVESWGYEAIPVSAASGAGLPALASALAGRVSVLAGPSGVGKSSLINALTLRAAGARLIPRPCTLLRLCKPVTQYGWRVWRSAPRCTEHKLQVVRQRALAGLCSCILARSRTQKIACGWV